MAHHQAAKGGRPYLRLGLAGTDPLGRNIPEGIPLDDDLTTAADPSSPLFAPCVTCHDPHGSGSPDVTKSNSNAMLRLAFKRDLCVICH
jgi:predicted CXXCH cytochrome family protein